MDPSGLSNLGALLDEALALAPDEQRVFIDRVTAGDPTLRQPLLDLLDAHDAAAAYFDDLAAALTADVDLEIDAAQSRDRHIGPWKLLRLLGRGGMGAVYLAERVDGQFEQKAALKLARFGFDDGDARRRFLAERQIVARLEHPNIARLIDGGVTSDERPYFVMELVEGEPLLAYGDGRRLSVRERLALFLQLGDAVQYAHRHLVVHRDVKPSNVLVTPDGHTKLLDFGIAKLLDPVPGMALLGTVTRDRALTPLYAAPEQITGDAITTATDVYSLGVVLYELLTGRRPFEIDGRTPRDLEHDVVERAPQRPSAVVRALPRADANTIAAARGTSADRLRRSLEGDLDTILLTALRKEPERRYHTAEHLVADIRRHLAGRPVTAREDTLRYRSWKFVTRHAVGVSMTAVIVLLVVAGTAALVREGARTARERDKAQSVAALLIDVFEVADPSEARGAQVTAREVLDRGVERVERTLEAQPDVQADLLGVLGRVHRNLGLYERATTLTARAAAVIAGLEGDQSPRAADARSRLGELLYLKGDYKAAEGELRAAVALQERIAGPRGAGVATALNHLGKVLQATGRLDEAEPVLRRALDISRERHGGLHTDVAEAVTNLGAVMFVRGELDEAEALFRQALDVRRRMLGTEHPLVAAALSNLATLLTRKGDLNGAEETGLEALRVARIVYGTEHPRVATMLNNAALTLLARGRAADAEPLLRESLAVRRALLPATHPDLAQSLANLGLVLQTGGTLDEAAQMYEEALSIRRQAFGDSHRLVAQTYNNLGLLAEARGDRVLAARHLQNALAILRRTTAADSPDLAFPLVGLGRLYTVDRRFADARVLLEEAVAIRRRHLPAGHADLQAAEQALADCLAAANQ
jgi:eukaryotic-like serine/threonine-protein kinase